MHQVEHASRHAGSVHDLGEDVPGEGRNFRGLQHHGAAGRDGGRHLADDLVQRPVPGRDEPADADGLLHQEGRAALFFELEVLQDVDGGGQVAHADRYLGALGEGGGGAHFLGHREGQVAEALLVLGQYAVEDVEALLAGGLGPGLEGLLGGGDSLVDVLG